MSDEDTTPRGDDKSDVSSPRDEESVPPANTEDDPTLTPEIRLTRCLQRATEFSSAGDREKAVEERIKCMALCRLVFGEDHLKYAGSCCDLGQAYLDCQNMGSQALKHTENVVRIMVASRYTSMREDEVLVSAEEDRSYIITLLVRTYYVQGQAWLSLKNLTKAQSALRKALLVVERSPTVESIGVDLRIGLFNLLGIVSRKAGRTGQAMEWFEKCIDLIETSYGAQSTELIQLYEELGKTEQRNPHFSDRERVLKHYEKSLLLAEAAFGENSVTSADCLMLIASTLMSIKEGKDILDATVTEKYLSKAIDIYRSTLEKGGRKLLAAQDAMISLKIQQNQLAEAADILRSVLTVTKETHGPKSEVVGDYYKKLGAVNLSQNEVASASKYLTRAQEIYHHVLGTNHKKYKDIVALSEAVKRNPSVKQRFQSQAEKLQERPRFTANVSKQQIPSLF